MCGSPNLGFLLARGRIGKGNDSLVTDILSNLFVTCFYAVLEPKSANLKYANAGHDLPYLRRRSGDAKEPRARGMPLGLTPGMSYEDQEVVLHGDEVALFYSDGLVEAHNPKGEMFGFPKLRSRVAEHGGEESLGDSLLEELYSFTGEDWEQEDDITFLTLHVPRPENDLRPAIVIHPPHMPIRGRVLALLGIVVVALNLQLAITSLSVLYDAIGKDVTGLSVTLIGIFCR